MKAIRVGPRPMDACREAIAIVAVYSDHSAELAGKHPFTSAQLDQLWEQGRRLLDALRSRLTTVTHVWRESAIVIRDRFWTLFSEIHDGLREAGVVIFGLRQLYEHIPQLDRSSIAPDAIAPPRAATG